MSYQIKKENSVEKLEKLSSELFYSFNPDDEIFVGGTISGSVTSSSTWSANSTDSTHDGGVGTD